MKNQILFEGFYDDDAGWDFDMPIFLISPYVQMFIHGNAGAIEYIIEDYFIDLDIGNKWSNDRELDKKAVLEDFKASKKSNKRFKYWYALVEYDTKNPMEYVTKAKKGW